jgi:hypothetical protein
MNQSPEQETNGNIVIHFSRTLKQLKQDEAILALVRTTIERQGGGRSNWIEPIIGTVCHRLSLDSSRAQFLKDVHKAYVVKDGEKKLIDWIDQEECGIVSDSVWNSVCSALGGTVVVVDSEEEEIQLLPVRTSIIGVATGPNSIAVNMGTINFPIQSVNARVKYDMYTTLNRLHNVTVQGTKLDFYAPACHYTLVGKTAPKLDPDTIAIVDNVKITPMNFHDIPAECKPLFSRKDPVIRFIVGDTDHFLMQNKRVQINGITQDITFQQGTIHIHNFF